MSTHRRISNIKAVIFNGGRGVRLSKVTKGVIPKGYIKFKNKPLISYQLDVLKRIGIRDVIIVVTSRKDIAIFNEFQNKKLVPRGLNYEILFSDQRPLGQYSHPYLTFRSDNIFKLIKGNDILCLHSDSVFYSQDVKELLKKVESAGNVSVVTSFAKQNVNKIPFVVEKTRLIKPKGKINCAESDLAGIVYFSNKDLRLINRIVKKRRPHINTFIAELLNKGRKIELLKLNFYINMNTMVEYKQVKEFINSNPTW